MVLLLCAMASLGYLYYAKSHSEAAAFKFGGSAGLQELQSQQRQQTRLQLEQNELVSGKTPEKGQKEAQLITPEERERQKEQKILKQLKENEILGKLKVPANTLIRVYYWQNYIVKIVSSPKRLLIGSNEIPNRDEYPSAHNYYIDFIYHFGFIAIMPILALLAYTCTMIYRHRQKIYLSPGLTGLCSVTIFLLLIDNSLKVGLRQPYSGIFTFFLWGMLLSRLSALNATGDSHRV